MPSNMDLRHQISQVDRANNQVESVEEPQHEKVMIIDRKNAPGKLEQAGRRLPTNLR